MPSASNSRGQKALEMSASGRREAEAVAAFVCRRLVLIVISRYLRIIVRLFSATTATENRGGGQELR